MSDDQFTDKSASAPKRTPKPTRRGHSKYPPTKPEMVEAVLVYHDQAVACLQGRSGTTPPDYAALARHLPHGSIVSAELHDWPQGPVFGVRIGERNPRFLVPSGLLITVALCLFGGPPFIDTNKKGGQEQHYVEVLADGFTLQRLMAGAEPGEAVKLIGDHHDLTPWSLRIEPNSPRAMRDRRGAIRAALARYDRNAAEWGLSGLLSRDDYERLLRGVFRLFDAEHGRHLLRPIRAA